AQRMAQLVDQMLELARLESGQPVLDLRAVEPVAAVETAVQSLHPLFLGKRHQVEVVVRGKTPKVLADASGLNQALVNLLSNAIKYTPEEGRIRVAIEPLERAVRFEVRDNGMGMKQDEVQHLFSRFYRSSDPATRRAPGTGLGLVITRRLIERHGGEIVVASAPGKGTAFAFTIPAVAAGGADMEEARQ
ncbi:MAG: sensor histidine kinase, partial [Thermomicrobiales bacterium]